MVFVPEYILILFLIILIDYAMGITIEKAKGRAKLIYLIISLCANIAMLAFFKYFNFFNENLASVFSFFGKEFQPVNLNVILPIGLSFHTFQSMSYTIEVYRGKQKAERHLGYFANYVLFFPQMVAGPIERYDNLGEALKTEHKPVYQNFSDGFKLILFGLFVKMVVADNIAPFVNQIYADPLKYSSLRVIGAVLLFSIQIYADFFGYSTIALGSARLLGIKIMDNFNTPYLSKSVSEFWTRWHISLSTWFRDYLYFPLGGNRVKLPRWCFNIITVFLISGLWHGANWTFVVWGLLHGLILLVERFVSKVFKLENEPGWNLLNVLLILKTFIITSIVWVFFRAENFEKVTQIFRAIIKNGPSPADDETPYLRGIIFAVILIVMDAVLYNSRFDRAISNYKVQYRWAVYMGLIFCVMALSGIHKYAFIYFQF